jgi:predicted DNA-binding transcriptional regulator YafY
MTRTDRLTSIILLLQQQPRTAAELARHFEVSRRTVLRDVQALCEIGVPVIAQEGARGGYSLPADYSIPPLQLSVLEIVHLLLALQAVEGPPQVPFPQERLSLTAKLRALIHQRHHSEVERWMAVLSFDVPPRAERSSFVEDLLCHAREEQWVQATYQSARGPSTRVLLPKRLSCRNGVWYCEAYTPDAGELRTYRADRFLAIELAEPPVSVGPSTPPLPYDHPSHPEVVVRLTPHGVRVVEGERHLGQAVQRAADGSGIWRFRCPPSELDWLTRYLLPLGPEAEVEHPDELRRRLRRAATEILSRYPER